MEVQSRLKSGWATKFKELWSVTWSPDGGQLLAVCSREQCWVAVQCDILRNDLNNGTVHLQQVCRQTEVGGVFDRPGCCAAAQRDLDGLEKQVERILMKLNKRNCKTLHLKRNNPMYGHRLGTDCLERTRVSYWLTHWTWASKCQLSPGLC